MNERERRGTALLLMLLIGYVAVLSGRETLFSEEGPPAFFVEERQGILVSLGGNDYHSGVHQFPDGIDLLAAISLTDRNPSPSLVRREDLLRPLRDGEALLLRFEGGEISDIQRSWMPAKQRLALGIPLHPEAMTREDWQALSGIGPKLAQTIEEDRQKNGDFGCLESLQRVRGIGPRRILEWKKLFQPCSDGG